MICLINCEFDTINLMTFLKYHEREYESNILVLVSRDNLNIVNEILKKDFKKGRKKKRGNIQIIDLHKGKFLYNGEIHCSTEKEILKVCDKSSKNVCFRGRYQINLFKFNRIGKKYIERSTLTNIRYRKDGDKSSKINFAIKEGLITNMSYRNNKKFEVNFNFIQNYLISEIMVKDIIRWQKTIRMYIGTYWENKMYINSQLKYRNEMQRGNRDKFRKMTVMFKEYPKFEKKMGENIGRFSSLLEKGNGWTYGENKYKLFEGNEKSRKLFKINFAEYCARQLFLNGEVWSEKDQGKQKDYLREFLLRFLNTYSRKNAPFEIIKRYIRCKEVMQGII